RSTTLSHGVSRSRAQSGGPTDEDEGCRRHLVASRMSLPAHCGRRVAAHIDSSTSSARAYCLRPRGPDSWLSPSDYSALICLSPYGPCALLDQGGHRGATSPAVE